MATTAGPVGQVHTQDVPPLALATPAPSPCLHTVCAWCGHVRDVRGGWHVDLAAAAVGHSRMATHGICPECRARIETEDAAC